MKKVHFEEIDVLKRENNALKRDHQSEIEKVSARYRLEIDDVRSTYENEIDVNETLNRSHVSAIEEVRSENRLRERELENRLQKVTSEDSALLQEFRQRLEQA